jgi:hypothetical protein
MRPSDTCTHTRRTPDVYVESVDEFHGCDTSHWEYGVVESTTEDVDTHRYRCTQCGQIGYYSNAARKYYEAGVRAPGIKGLE